MVERWRSKAIAGKHQIAREEIGLSTKEEENYESNTRDETNLDQANDEYLLSNWEIIRKKL